MATNTVFHDAAHLSRLDFQVLPDDTDGDSLPDVWEADNFGSLQRSGNGDLDGDGLDDHGEYLAGTQPTNAASLLRIEDLRLLSPADLQITWQSVSNRTYDLLAATGSLASALSPIATNIAPAAPFNTLHITPPGAEAAFFRVRTSP